MSIDASSSFLRGTRSQVGLAHIVAVLITDPYAPMQLRRAPQHAESLPGSLGRSDVRYRALRSDHVELVRHSDSPPHPPRSV